jgi:hypothetical protein
LVVTRLKADNPTPPSHDHRVRVPAHDFSRVLDHVHADPVLRIQSVLPFNASDHDDWRAYYTADLANMVYGAYEPDFDRFQYPRAFSH